MNALLSILTAVMVNIISYYICKWLDSRHNGN